MQTLLKWTFCPAVLLLILAAAYAHAQDDPGSFPGFTPENTIRGTVTATSTNVFTIRTDEGETYKVLYSVNSRIVKDRGPAKSSDIHIGDMMIATGNLDKKAHTVGAAILLGVDAEDVKKAREGLGKTWTAGKVTAIHLGDEPTITLDRLDGVKQTFAVDENTSFQHRHESITLGDIKTGDSLRADGHLNGKLFLATSVHLFTAGEHGGNPTDFADHPGAGYAHPSSSTGVPQG
jgi:hypothetical protein